MGNCESVDGKRLNAGNEKACWQEGGATWKQWGSGAINNPNIPAVVAKLEPKSADAAKVVGDAKTAQATAVVATAAAGKAEQTAVVATQNAEVAKAAAEDAKTVRDKCIKAANEAHQKAMQACGPELGVKKEGFGDSEGFGGGCGIWLLLLIIILVFVAICMQGKDSSASRDDIFQINSALV